MIMSKLLYENINGNSKVTLYSNGTRCVETLDPDATQFLLDYPLSLDINISNCCSNGCPYCYAGNTPEGKIADLSQMIYLDGVTGMEIAINIQFPLPNNFIEWLEKMKGQSIIVNGTINQIDLERDPSLIDWLKELHDKELIHGIGISFRKYDGNLYNKINSILGEDIVVHTIIGVTPIPEILKLMDSNFKILILGYKQKNRGIDYFANVNINKWVKDINIILNHPKRNVIAFDTAGLKQANLKTILDKDQWDRSFQGDEGTISFYIDAVKNTFNIDSHTLKTPHGIGDRSLKDMFNTIKEEVNTDEDI